MFYLRFNIFLNILLLHFINKYNIDVSPLKYTFYFRFRLFEGSSPKKIEKLKTLLCYFQRVTQTSKPYKFLVCYFLLKAFYDFTCKSLFLKNPRVLLHSQDKLLTIHQTGKGNHCLSLDFDPKAVIVHM